MSGNFQGTLLGPGGFLTSIAVYNMKLLLHLELLTFGRFAYNICTDSNFIYF